MNTTIPLRRRFLQVRAAETELRQNPQDWFHINYTDPNTGFHAGCHQDEDHPDRGRAHFQYSVADDEDRWRITFEHETPSLIFREIIEELFQDVRLTYQYANEKP